jgi:Tol biopolymer transport system component
MNRHLSRVLILVVLASCVSAPSDAQDIPSENDAGGPGGQAVPAKTSGVSKVFRVAKPEMLMLLSHDGKHLRPLCDVPSHPTIGSPALSPAGDMIACDGNRPGMSYEGTELLLMKADGTDVECLGNGAMPSWAADGKRIAFSCNAPRGVWVLDLATKKRELIDKDGWGIQWSPDEKSWAYSRRGSLVVKNVASGEVHEQESTIGDSQPYWGWNMAWSPDSRSLCGVVQLRNGQTAVAVQSLQLPEADDDASRGGIRLVSIGREINRDVAWHPSGNRIVFTAFSAATDRFQMFEFDPTIDSIPSAVAGQTATNNFDQCWSADGKTLVYIAHFDVDEAEPSDAAESR